jgi:Bacterial antitoxin of type II TA system, VapB
MKQDLNMPTQLAVDDSLIEEACQLSPPLTANEVATQALQEYIQRRKQLKLLDLFGTVEYHDDYNPKQQRGFRT